MKYIHILCVSVLLLFLQSCVEPFFVYFRNFTDKDVVIDVFINDKTLFYHLPNKVSVAEKLVKFKGGYRQYFSTQDYVQWLDTAHLRYVLKPGTTVYANELAGSFTNSSPNMSGIITVTKESHTDTLLNANHVFRHDLFSYKHNFPFRSILYYDAK